LEPDKFDSSKKLRWLILGLRMGLYLLPLLLMLMVHLGQDDFFNWQGYFQFYLISLVGLIFSFFSLLFQEKLFPNPLLLRLSFFFDAALVLSLQYFSQLQTSIFLFLYIVVIIISALASGVRVSLLLAVFISLGFNICSLLGPDLKVATYFFQLVLYNIAFFTVAWIAGLLSEQLESQGLSLQKLKLLNESIVETIPSGLLTVDQGMKIISWNPGALQIFGDTLSEGRLLSELLQQVQDQLSFEHLNSKDIIWKTESEQKILSVRVLPHSVVADYKLVLVDDVTELRRLELQLRHQEKLAAVGGLAAGIAHELGNPLAAVSANIQFLGPKIKIEDESDKKLLDNTHKEIARLGRLIGEFKDFAKPEKVPVDFIRLDQLLGDVLDQVSRDPSLNQNISVTRILNEVPPVRGARDKLIQVFMNLIMNAYHAVQNVSDPEIKVLCVIRSGFIEIRISDNGIGMNAETKARIFEPFFTTKGRSGTGLGLAIAHKILEAHQVQVHVESEQGKGTEFTLQFPVQQMGLDHRNH